MFKTLVITVTLVLIGAVSPTRAELLFTVSGVGDLSAGRNENWTVGSRFNVGAEDVTIDALGFQDFGLDGLQTAHEVGLWDDNGGTGVLLASATIKSGTQSPLDSVWRFEPVEPLVLTAGMRYRIGAVVFQDGDSFTDTSNPAAFAINPDAIEADNIRGDAFVNGGFAYPRDLSGATQLRWVPANARIAGAVIPEPTTYALLAFAGIGLAAYQCRRRRKRAA